MNTVKFRAWFDDGKSQRAILKVGDDLGTTHPLDCCKYAMEGQPVTLLQYSGRKDKNGAEIYLDCDIFKFKYMTSPTEHVDLVGVMTFNDEDLRVEINIYPETDGYICLSYIGNSQMYDFEIIGTMQENPELLKI